MWCQACRQDVPALVSGPGARRSCGRCGGRLGLEQGPLAPTFSTTIADDGVDLEHVDLKEQAVRDIRADLPQADLLPLDNVELWRLDQQVRRVHRYLDAIRAQAIDQPEPSARTGPPERGAGAAKVVLGGRASSGPPATAYPVEAPASGPWSLPVLCGIGAGLAASLVGAAVVGGRSLNAYQAADGLGLWLLVGGQAVLAAGLFGAVLRARRSPAPSGAAAPPAPSAARPAWTLPGPLGSD